MAVPETQSYSYPDWNTGALSINTWLLNQFSDFRLYVHSCLNASELWLYNWNLTTGTKGIERRTLAYYVALLPAIYELTNDVIYLVEAQWLLDKYVDLEGETGYSYDFIYFNDTSSHGFFHHDAYVWFAMQRLNELYGTNYDVTTRVDWAISLAYYDNSTDLGWEYYYWQQSGDLTNYIVNTFAPMMFLLSYLDYLEVQDYSDEIDRLYTTIERFRADDEKYIYKMSDPKTTGNDHYTLILLSNLFLANIYQPDIINTTKIQASINAYSFAEMRDLTKYDMMTCASIALNSIHQSLTLTHDCFNRTIAIAYDLFQGFWLNRFTAKRFFVDGKWTAGVNVGASMVSLASLTDLSVTLKTPAMETEATYYRRSNYALFDATPTAKYFFIAGSGRVEWHWSSPYFSQFASGGLTIDAFNETLNCFTATTTATGDDLHWQWDKHLINVNWSSADSHVFDVFRVSKIFDGNDWAFLFANGTRTTMSNYNGTLQLSEVFAIELNATNHHYTYIFKTDNSTFSQQTYEVDDPADSFYINSTITEFQSYYILDDGLTLDNAEKAVCRTWVVAVLARLENGQAPIYPETTQNRAEGWVIHSDAVISNYRLTSSELSFSLSGSGGIDTSYIYTGNRGEPVSIHGAYSWSFDEDSKLLTVTTAGTDIVIDWTPEVSGLYELTVSVKLDGVPLLGVNVTVTKEGIIAHESVETNLLGFAVFVLPYGFYTVTACYGDHEDSVDVWVNQNKAVGIEFKSQSGKHIGAEVLLVPVFLLVLFFIVFPRLRRRR